MAYTQTNFIVDRLINERQAAEGTSLPQRIRAGIRVPVVTNVRVTNKEKLADGTRVTIAWTAPKVVDLITNYRIYVVENAAANSSRTVDYSFLKSPATIDIKNTAVYPVTFQIFTELHNGQSSDCRVSPAISTRTII